MAQKVLVQLVDDLDGTSATDIETVTFALDGVNYEIDLGPKNARKLRENLADFVSEARRVGGRMKRGTAAKTAAAKAPAAPANREQTKAIREWARSQGHNLSTRGRIPAHIVEEFEAAHQPKQTKKGGRGGRKKAATPSFSG
ncbi:histone-like nucleoid-structuring protein Lsr2 [Sciscionella marina]|uniref:histone-like nucleoid-structuring protein Lsr2 n=1 Tax=Sciscionella marina TaxID=508770 RepID=UPI000380D842